MPATPTPAEVEQEMLSLGRLHVFLTRGEEAAGQRIQLAIIQEESVYRFPRRCLCGKPPAFPSLKKLIEPARPMRFLVHDELMIMEELARAGGPLQAKELAHRLKKSETRLKLILGLMVEAEVLENVRDEGYRIRKP